MSDIEVTLARIEERLVNLIEDNKREHKRIDEHLTRLNGKTEKTMLDIALQKQMNALQEQKLVSHDKKINSLIMRTPNELSLREQVKQPAIAGGLLASSAAILAVLKQYGLI